MTKCKPLSPIGRLTASHLRLLKVIRGQIKELGELRKAILDMRHSVGIMRQLTAENRELMERQREKPSEWKWDIDALREAGVFPNDWPRL